jgi:hypothetical protein
MFWHNFAVIVLIYQSQNVAFSSIYIFYHCYSAVHGLEYRLISMTEKGVTEVESARANKETPVEKYPLEQLV